MRACFLPMHISSITACYMMELVAVIIIMEGSSISLKGLCVRCDIPDFDEIIGDVLAQDTEAWHWEGKGGGRGQAQADTV